MWAYPDTFEVEKPKALNPEALKPHIEDEDNKKKLFGIELAKGVPSFQAACNVANQNNAHALWIVRMWINDPIVLAAKDTYTEASANKNSLLDKNELAALLLSMAREKSANGTFYTLDGKDRIKVLELYADVMGLRDNKNNLQQTNFTFNKIAVRFIEPENKKEETKTIDNNEFKNSELKSPLKLKLIG